MKKLKIIPVLLIALILAAQAAPKNHTVSSPDGKLIAQIEVSDKIYYSLFMGEKQIIAPSPVSMLLADGTVLGANGVVSKKEPVKNDQVLTPLYGKRKQIRDNYNELTLTFKGNYTFTVRMYDEGFAYRFGVTKAGELIVKDEEATFNFASNGTLWSSLTGGFEHSYENLYNVRQLSAASDSLSYLPVLVQSDNGLSVLIMESDLEDYPGFHVTNNQQAANGMKAAFPKVPTKWEPGGHMKFNLIVKERADYIAKTQGPRQFPWRVLKVATNDIQLLDTDLIYKLSDPQAEGIDFSWVKPGVVAWDWWSAMNLTAVDFRAGVNTETYKFYIDFADENGFEYINLDEGWSSQYDLMKLFGNVNLKEIADYGKSKGVGVFLWCVHYPLDEKLDEAMKMFQELGIAGLKIDFMDRDDQVMIDYYHRIARAAAEHKLLVNYHGASKPDGLHRKYPNVINRESVRGLEYNKFSRPLGTPPEYAVTIPFIRMAAGPMDYTPGALNNAQKNNFAVIDQMPMSQGTRCQQLAMYVIYDAPLQMLSDLPTAYRAEPVILDYLKSIPTVWDETIALDGKVGDYAIIARKSGLTWYVAGMTDWDRRKVNVTLPFIGEGNYKASIYQDGINADRNGKDYVLLERTIDKTNSVEMKMAPGGGFVMVITPL
jgi:alpha-glucosidase